MSKDVRVIQVDPVTRRVSFAVSAQPIDGIDLLIQVVVLSLLNSPGRDVLDPDDGGGFPEMIGMNIDATDNNEVVGEIMRRVSKSELQIINAQTGLTLSPLAKLRKLHVASVAPGENIDEVLVTIRVVNQAGQTADIVA